MSSIYVEIGQCGCQIGLKLNKKLSNSYYSTRIYPPNKVHAIMIDTQPKVLKPYLDNPPKWLDVKNVKYFQHGRGNNWSYGYMHQLPEAKNTQYIEGYRQFSHLAKEQQSLSPAKSNNPPQEQKLTEFEQKVLIDKYLVQNKCICEYTLERIRKQLDTMDCPLAINVLCSLGGGTGSGLGTKIIECIYDQLNMDIYAHVVLPNKSGQTPLQIYNCTLSLASIQQHSTAIFPYENDKMINTFLDGGEHKIGTDLDYINDCISEMQARLFRINEHDAFDRFYTDVINQCLPGAHLKYVSLFGTKGEAIKEEQGGVDGLLDGAYESLCNQLRVYNQELYQIEGFDVKRQRSLAHSMILIGNASENQLQDVHRKKLKNLLYPWQINPELLIEYIPFPKKPPQLQGKTSNNTNLPQILLLNNSSNITRYLQYLCTTGRRKFEAKAYLWHYKYANLEEAFNSLETVVDQYFYSAHN